ncbi:hypothetical protein D9611_012365 [Ephemerocybe angulata]|uniref:CHAT domain-containing protein n=1 Tax=Ephemerocybe angulata TaxID=980116 RepID=A0A8H5CE02_9AGAR|nr:hypothetical protein D9611_012365 [Tulosesus angulatus]
MTSLREAQRIRSGSNSLLAEAGVDDSHEQLFEDGVALTEQYKDTRTELDGLSTAISKLRRAVELMPKDHSDMALRLSWLDHSLWSHFKRTGDLQDLDEAISMEHRALELTPEGHPDMPVRLANLGTSLWSRFEHTGDIQDLAEAILAKQRALELTPEGHPYMALRLNGLGTSLHSRFEHTGDLQDIVEAISMKRRVVDLTPEGHPEMAKRLANLGTSLHSRFDRAGDLQDLAEAILAEQRALEPTPEGHPDMPVRLANLGTSIHSRFERTGDLQDLAEAISAEQRALEITPEGHPVMALQLANLGISLWSRFERTGDLQDLAEAISRERLALKLTPEGHPKMAVRLAALGSSLWSRFERTGDLQDLAEAISAQQRALDLTPEGHPDMALRLNGLGTSIHSRFERTGDLQDIVEAISMKRRVVDLTPEGHPDMSLRLANLGNLQDLAEAIPAQQRALDLTPEGHPDRALRLAGLGSSLWGRFELTGDLPDIAEAISADQRALELTPEGHPYMPAQLRNLGIALHSCFLRTGDIHDFTEALSKYSTSATSTFGPPDIRLQAAKDWAGLLEEHNPGSPDILTAFDTAIRLTTLTTTLDQVLENRYSRLVDTSGVALQAASAAFALDRVDKALEWLEQGRCLVWRQLTSLRTPLDDLRRHDGHLADRFLELSKTLEGAGSVRIASRSEMSMSQKVSLEDQARIHVRSAREWDDLLVKIRATPGFERFLEPSPWYSLLPYLPEAGHAIIINVDARRCDAIVLSAGRSTPHHIPLTSFSLAKCNQYRQDLKAQLQIYDYRDRGHTVAIDPEGGDESRTVTRFKHRKNEETVVQGILRGLWQDLVKPILQTLEIQKIPSSPTTLAAAPRIWWCPTGPLSFLPIHAAGIYTAEGAECALDYAVSSYTPTLAALVDRVRSTRPIQMVVSGLFMTCQPRAAGGSHIPGTTAEVQSIYDLATKNGLRVERFDGSAITPATCLDSMEKFSSIHLACHAYQDATNPLESRFLFHNGSLDLFSILQRNLKDADLAFLSACQTGTGSEKLPDEAVHLAAGMLAAGYRRVVATMWAIRDQHAPHVATDFYQYLLDHRDPAYNGSGFDGTHSARALHHATQQLRIRLGNDSDESLLAWIPYVHFGF